MSDPFKTKEFQALKAKWDKKLEKSGLQNIEQADGNLKIWTSKFFKVHFNPILYDAKEEYYRLAGQFLHSHTFKTKTEALIWELHSEALSILSIQAIFKKKRRKVSVVKIQRTIKALSNIMLAHMKREAA